MGLFILALFGMGAVGVSAAPSASILEAKLTRRSEMIEKKLSIIQEKASMEIKGKLAEKIKLKEENKTAAQQAANAETQTQAAIENETAEVTSGASQSGREIGETNRAYGQQLSDPNLSEAERQAIIQEKKDYNRGRH